jgi:hypothetical protein
MPKKQKLQESWSLNEFWWYLRLGLGIQIGKKQDGAEIQNCDDGSQGNVFAHMKSVNFFHEIGFKRLNNAVSDFSHFHRAFRTN